MADGALIVKLSDYTNAKLVEKAKAMGIEPADLAAMMLDDKFLGDDDYTWINGDPRNDHASNYDLAETGRLWSDIRPELIARLENKLAERK